MLFFAGKSYDINYVDFYEGLFTLIVCDCRLRCVSMISGTSKGHRRRRSV